MSGLIVTTAAFSVWDQRTGDRFTVAMQTGQIRVIAAGGRTILTRSFPMGWRCTTAEALKYVREAIMMNSEGSAEPESA